MGKLLLSPGYSASSGRQIILGSLHILCHFADILNTSLGYGEFVENMPNLERINSGLSSTSSTSGATGRTAYIMIMGVASLVILSSASTQYSKVDVALYKIVPESLVYARPSR